MMGGGMMGGGGGAAAAAAAGKFQSCILQEAPTPFEKTPES